MTLRRALLPLVLFALAAGPAHGLTAEELAQKLPRRWCGTFIWGMGDTPQRYRVVFDTVTAAPDGTVVAVGTGINHSTESRETRVVFRARFVAATLAATMTEADPKPATPGYLTDGELVGRLAPSLDRIEARWRDSRGLHTLSRLVLDAGPRASRHPHCVDAVS